MQTIIKIIVLGIVLRSTIAYSQTTITFDTISLSSKVSFSYISDIYVDRTNTIWIPTARGLYQINGYSGEYYVFNPNDSLCLYNNIVSQIYEDDQGRLWVMTDRYLQWFDPISKTFHLVLKDYIDEKNISYKWVFTKGIQIDHNRLIIGLKQGLLIYNKKDKTYEYNQIVEEVRADGYSSNAHLLDVTQDLNKPNIFYLLTRGGLYRFDSVTDSLINLNVKNVDFSRILPPRVRMRSQGNYLFFVVYDSIVKYNIETGELEFLNFLGMEPDTYFFRDFVFVSDSLMVASTAKDGIFQYKIGDQGLTKFSDGLYNKLAMDQNNYLWTVQNTEDMLRSAHPVSNKINTEIKHVSIDQCWVNNISVLNREVFKTNSYDLRDFQRDLTFQISLKNPKQRDSVDYEYALDDNNWKSASSDRMIALKDVAPGGHKLRYRAITTDFVAEGKPLHFSIEKYFYEKWWFRGLIILTIGLFILSLYYLHRLRQKDIERHKKNILTMELNALRSQMNPHFLFNTLNSIKNYVLTKSPDDAAHYLTRFAQLIRSILENSKSSFLSLEAEIDAIRLYIEMEHLRFDKDFDYTIDIDPQINMETFKLAPMLIQPYVENAIWHGLMNKKTGRTLSLAFTKTNLGVQCVIEDNGIGRAASVELYKDRMKSKKSLGMHITQNRISNINKIYNIESSVKVLDVIPQGTKVIIQLPEIKTY